MIIKKLIGLATLIFVSFPASATSEKLFFLSEGGWQQDNGKLGYFADGEVVSNELFRSVNGRKLGDTPNDIVEVNENLYAIAVNWSNIIQFIDADGKAVAQTEDVPNNRELCSDGRYVWVSSFAHECETADGLKEFEHGFVAQIDTQDGFRVVSTVEVGYEPEGIALYRGHLFVANSGGYAFEEDHDYGKTISVIDAYSMTPVRTVDTGQINLSTAMHRSGRFLCVGAVGDYYSVPGATVIVDCDKVLSDAPDADCFVALPYTFTHSAVASDGHFWAVGGAYSYISGNYTFNCLDIDPEEVFNSKGATGVNDRDPFPGTVNGMLREMDQPYGIYVNPYSGYIYATDAGAFVASGYLYQWNPEGELLSTSRTYINPGHMLALRPEGWNSAPEIEAPEDADAPKFNLQGIRIDSPRQGEIYIQRGRKAIAR